MLIHRFTANQGQKVFIVRNEDYNGPYFCELKNKYININRVEKDTASHTIVIEANPDEGDEVIFYKLVDKIPLIPISEFKETLEYLLCRSKFFQLRGTVVGGEDITGQLRRITDKIIENNGIIMVPYSGLNINTVDQASILKYLDANDPVDELEGTGIVVTDRHVHNITIKNMIGHLRSLDFIVFSAFFINAPSPISVKDITPIALDIYTNRQGNSLSNDLVVDEHYVQVKSDPIIQSKGPLQDLFLRLSSDALNDPLTVDLYLNRPANLKLVPVSMVGYGTDELFSTTSSNEVIDGKDLIRYRYTQQLSVLQNSDDDPYYHYRWATIQ